MSVETGIAPEVLMYTDRVLIDGLWAELAWRAQQAKKQQAEAQSKSQRR